MVSVHQVQSGVFRFEWTPNEFPPKVNDMCVYMFSMETISINYGGRESLYDVEYLCLLGALKVIITPHSDTNYPQKIMATLFGEQKEMEEFSTRWEQSWRDSAFERVPCYCGQKPNLLVIFDFRSPIEDCVLNQLPIFDVNFHVQGKIFGAHKSVVSASPVMAAMFQGNYFNKKSLENIEITDVPPQVFKHVLIFMYTGKTPHTSASTSLFEMLFFTADKYQIQALRDVTESKLAHKVSREDAIHFLKMGHIHSAPKLLEASHQCIEKNRVYIWETQEWKDLMRKYPELFFHASQRMAANRLYES